MYRVTIALRCTAIQVKKLLIDRCDTSMHMHDMKKYISIAGPFMGKSTSRRWISLTKDSNAELLYFLVASDLIRHVLYMYDVIIIMRQDLVNAGKLHAGRHSLTKLRDVSTSFHELTSWKLTVKLMSGECHRTHWWKVNIVSSNGLVRSGTKPLP